LYLGAKIFWILLDMKSKKVYVYVIIVIWNFIRFPGGGQNAGAGDLPEGKTGSGADFVSRKMQAAPGLNGSKRPTKIK
jgi:hypothetical protein